MTIRSIRLPRFLVPLGKLTLVPLLLWMIARNALTGMGVGSFAADYFLIGIALMANQIALYVFAVRMHMVLGIFGIPISSFQAQRIHLQSVFYYYALPMTVGLEVSRFAKVRYLVGGGVSGLTLGSALLLDRLIGAVAALAITVALLPFVSIRIVANWSAYWLLAIPLSLAALATSWYYRRRVRELLSRTLGLIMGNKRQLWATLFIAVLTHIFFAYGVFAGGEAFSLHIPFVQTLFVVSSAMLFVVLPVSFAGISAVEAASFGVLVALGQPEKQALIFVLITYFAKLVAAVEGACWEIFDGGLSFMKPIDRGG